MLLMEIMGILFSLPFTLPWYFIQHFDIRSLCRCGIERGPPFCLITRYYFCSLLSLLVVPGQCGNQLNQRKGINYIAPETYKRPVSYRQAAVRSLANSMFTHHSIFCLYFLLCIYNNGMEEVTYFLSLFINLTDFCLQLRQSPSIEDAKVSPEVLQAC